MTAPTTQLGPTGSVIHRPWDRRSKALWTTRNQLSETCAPIETAHEPTTTQESA